MLALRVSKLFSGIPAGDDVTFTAYAGEAFKQRMEERPWKEFSIDHKAATEVVSPD